MKIHRVLLENIIYSEMLVVVLIIISAGLISLFFNMRKKANKKISDQIEAYLLRCMLDGQSFTVSTFLKPWRRINLILPIIHKVNFLLKTPAWEELKLELSRKILLPIARKKYKSYSWVNRLLAAKCFELAFEEQDELPLCTLLKDKIPLVHMHAVVAAVKFANMNMIDLVITTMSEKRRLAQAIYLKIFESAPPDINTLIEERLKTEQNLFTRATCYKILQTLPIVELEPTVAMVPDIRSPNIELRFSVIRFMASSLKEKSIPILIKLLSDEQWEIRATCIRILASFQDPTVVPELVKYLDDPVHSVRVNTENALKHLGREGQLVLRTRDSTKKVS